MIFPRLPHEEEIFLGKKANSSSARFHRVPFLLKSLSNSLHTLCIVGVILFSRWAFALPTCCQMSEEPITIEYFTLKEGHKEIIKDVNDPNYPKCFLGYFIPEFGEKYILASGKEMKFTMPEGWTLVEEKQGDKRYHQSPNGAPGVDIFGWVDSCCKVHLFDQNDQVYAWKEGPIVINNPDNKEIQIGHPGGSADIYIHIAAKNNLGDAAKQGDLLGTLEASDNVHLHFSVKVDGDYKNPLLFMEKKSKTCVIFEPLSALLIATGSLIFAAKRKRRQK